MNSATRRRPSSRAFSPASASTPRPNVNVGMPMVKPWSLPSTSSKSAWQQRMGVSSCGDYGRSIRRRGVPGGDTLCTRRSSAASRAAGTTMAWSRTLDCRRRSAQRAGLARAPDEPRLLTTRGALARPAGCRPAAGVRAERRRTAPTAIGAGLRLPLADSRQSRSAADRRAGAGRSAGLARASDARRASALRLAALRPAAHAAAGARGCASTSGCRRTSCETHAAAGALRRGIEQVGDAARGRESTTVLYDFAVRGDAPRVAEEFSVVLNDLAVLLERIKLLQEEVAARVNEQNNGLLLLSMDADGPPVHWSGACSRTWAASLPRLRIWVIVGSSPWSRSGACGSVPPLARPRPRGTDSRSHRPASSRLSALGAATRRRVDSMSAACVPTPSGPIASGGGVNWR